MQKYVILSLIPNHENIKHKLINDYPVNKLTNSLLNHNFDELLTDNNRNKSITDFQNTLLHYYNLSFSIKSKTISRKKLFQNVY